MTKPASQPPHPSILPFAVMCVGMFIALLDIQIVASSLQDIGGGLSAAQDEISWVQTAYLIAEIVMIPLSGWLSRLLSTRILFVASALGFTVFSALCATATSLGEMILYRAMQGFSGGAMIPSVFPVVYTKYSSAMGYVGRTRKRLSFVLVRAHPDQDPRGASGAAQPILGRCLCAQAGRRLDGILPGGGTQ